MKSETAPFRIEKLALGLAVVVVAVVLYPVNSFVTRVALIAAIASLWGVALTLCWKSLGPRLALLISPAIVVVFLLLPGRASDAKQVRTRYIEALGSYEGTLYFWGGEKPWAIDCSGLVRRALFDANLREGVATLNPALARRAIWLWWHDSSAAALGDGHLGQTKLLYEAASINDVDASKLLPGDLAVTATGIHVLAYLGDNRWVEADPVPGEVIIVETPAPANSWFMQPVKIVRWVELALSD